MLDDGGIKEVYSNTILSESLIIVISVSSYRKLLESNSMI